MGSTTIGGPAYQGKGGTLRPGVVLGHGYSITSDGVTHKGGDLVADDMGMNVQVIVGGAVARHRQIKRIPTVRWSSVTGIELTGSETSKSTVRGFNQYDKVTTAGTSVVTLSAASDRLVYKVPLPLSRVTQLLGRRIAEIEVRTASPVAAAPVVAVTPAVSVADELAKLAGLHDAGVLSDAEFGAAKARLLV